jgi:predicted acyl esterase
MTDTGGIVIERDLMVPARDGVVLATDVYRPDGPGPFPVLFERTPYDKSAPSRSERSCGREAAVEGRGRGFSPGTAMPSPIRIAAAAIVRAPISRNI